MNTKNMSAALLEKLLLVLIVLILAVTIGIYYFLFGFVKSQADTAAESVAKADSSQKDIDDLNKSYKWLQANPETIDKTSKIVAQASSYQYQDQVINDIESYANQSGLNVISYRFSELSGTGSAASSSAAPASSSSSSSTASSAATPPTAAAPSGLTQASIDIGLETGISYRKLLQFIKRIEQSVTRLQINSINISSVSGAENKKGVPDPVSVTTFTISVFLNKGV